MSRLVFRHLSQLATPLGNAARTGAAQGRVTRIVDAALVCEDGRIAWVGPDSGYVAAHGEAPRPDDVVLDGRGKTALPGFVDPHTHIPWAGYRESEFNERLKGKTYAEIAAAGGGIVSTVAATRAASVEELAAVTGERLDRMLLHGTTFCEAKTGYGLDLATEKKQLAALKAAADGHPVGVVATALPGH